jgi:hypothetical protein
MRGSEGKKRKRKRGIKKETESKNNGGGREGKKRERREKMEKNKLQSV